LTKRNNIHSFKLIEYIDTMKIAKNKKDEYVNKLTSSMLIAQNGKVLKLTHMTIFKSQEYSCLRICNVMTPKSLIWFALDRSWSDNLNRTNSWTKQERQTTSHKDDEQQSRTKTTESWKKKQNRCKNHLFQYKGNRKMS